MLMFLLRSGKNKNMFQKIVANLAFSPALIEQLGFYAKRLKREEVTRRLGLIFTAIALIVQSLTVFSPPQAANAASSADFVHGGVSSVNDFLGYYDRNSNHIRQIYASLGITRSEIAKAKYTVIGEDSRYNWAMRSLYSYSDGQRSWDYGPGKAYYRPMRLTQEGGDRHPVFASYSKTQGWFAIKKDCGNLITAHPPHKPPVVTPPTPAPSPVASCSALGLAIVNRNLVELSAQAKTSGGATVSRYTFIVKDAGGAIVKSIPLDSTALSVQADSFRLEKPGTYTAVVTVTTSLGERSGAACSKPFTISKPEVCQYNPSLPPSSPDCQPCPGNPQIWIKDETCKADLVDLKMGTNLTQGNVSASTVTAQASDRISYTISIKNKGLLPQKTSFEEELTDVLQYATLYDQGTGTFNETNQTLSWPEVSLAPNEEQSRTFVVQLRDQIPTTNTGTSDATSYDCKMTNTFGNTVEINVSCPEQKVIVEQTVAELPKTGPTENMLFAGSVGSVVTYFWARSRQLKKEVKLIRKDFNMGVL
jgi:hypothetical protein